MKLTILEVGKVPETLKADFATYPNMFETMFNTAGGDFTYERIKVLDGEAMPDPETLEGIVIPGSSSGVYDDDAFIAPLRDFIKRAYAANVPMVGICFGHQIMADTLGGKAEKSCKGWGLGRHVYQVTERPGFMSDVPDQVAVSCSHQDQVTVKPEDAEVILASEFTPNAGLYYGNGKALSFQPHPEFVDEYSDALVTLREGMTDAEVLDKAHKSISNLPGNQDYLAKAITRFFLDKTS